MVRQLPGPHDALDLVPPTETETPAKPLAQGRPNPRLGATGVEVDEGVLDHVVILVEDVTVP